jgi:uncharacterized protein
MAGGVEESGGRPGGRDTYPERVASVRMEYTKWDGRLHWHIDVESLGHDSHGNWYTGRPGIWLQRGEEPPIEEVDGFVMLVPRTGDWIAFWNRLEEPSIYVDVTTTPEVHADKIAAVDLDLDLIRWRDGRVTEDDRDEFELHQRQMAYPPAVVAGAEKTARWLEAAMTARQPPFDDTGAEWLKAASRAWPSAEPASGD